MNGRGLLWGTERRVSAGPVLPLLRRLTGRGALQQELMYELGERWIFGGLVVLFL